jgi:hypothetical protein
MFKVYFKRSMGLQTSNYHKPSSPFGGLRGLYPRLSKEEELVTYTLKPL